MIMQRLSTAVAGFLALTTSLAAAAVDSRIDRVTIHPGSLATVERTVTARVEAGDGNLVLEGLASDLETDSVTIAVESGGLAVGAVETATEAVGEPTRERERELQKQIEDLKQQRQEQRDRATSARSQIRFIEGLSQLPQQAEAGPALLDNDGSTGWAELWQRIGDGSREAHERLRTAEREAEALTERINALEQQRGSLGNAGREATTVTIPYRAQQAGEASLRVNYRVRGPEWQPRYEARLDSSAGTIELVRSATVRQATGTDWRDVQLRLSTSEPVRGELPEPQTWWVDLQSPQKQVAAESEADYAGRGAQKLAAAPSQAAVSADGPSRTVNAEFAATYEIAGRIDVPAGNQPRTVRIGSQSLDGELGASVYPQQDDRAWLTTLAKWDGDGPLPSGKIALFRDGAYVGEQHLATWAPGEERKLSFGVDPRVSVTFEPVRDEAGASGWINTQSTLARYYRLNVTNRHDLELPIRVLFRVPVARHEELEVSEDFSAEPDERDVDDRQGVHRWVMDLAAGESRSLNLGFKLAYPEEAELNGL